MSSSDYTSNKDGLQLLINDHRIHQGLFKQFKQVMNDSVQQKQRVMQQIAKELSIHTVIEEQFLYPTIEKLIDEETAMHGIKEHREVKEQLAKLESMDPNGKEYNSIALDMIKNVEHHINDEENEMFPALRKKMSKEELETMYKNLDNAKMVAPTHPHPNLPDKPPANYLNMVIGAAEQVSDKITGSK